MYNKKLAFLFPGQGSQARQMCSAYMNESIVADTFNEASQTLSYDILQLIRDNNNDRLHQTEYTQPALLTASIALLRLWRKRGGSEPAYLAGHSLGEYSALVAASSLSFIDAIRLVSFRGQAMQKAGEGVQGGMAAVLGLEFSTVSSLCCEVSTSKQGVWAANDNCPRQIVIAGHQEALQRAMDVAMADGARKVVQLAVSVPSHTPMMQAAADDLRNYMQDIAIKNADRPIWLNVSGKAEQNSAAIRIALLAQLTSPVRWTQSIIAMQKAGMQTAIEMGPGKILSGLVRRISRDIKMQQSDKDIDKAIEFATFK
ncbi:MAG: ACP S-malonyltransferase [Mariprofundales bacterium]